MTHETYLLKDNQLIVRDEELGIDLTCPCDVPVSRLLYPDGELKAEMYYVQGKLHGPSTFFAQTGQVLAQSWYVDGKKTGKVRHYFLSGKLASVQRFKDGQAEGVQEYWYENGTIKSLLPYQNGTLHGEVQLYWESGQHKRLCHYVQGLRHGLDQLWDQQGILLDEGEFSAGQPVSTHRRFYPDGKLREEIYYHSPVRYDRKEWNSDGKLIYEGIYAPDLTYTQRVVEGTRGATVKKGYWDGQRLRWK